MISQMINKLYILKEIFDFRRKKNSHFIRSCNLTEEESNFFYLFKDENWGIFIWKRDRNFANRTHNWKIVLSYTPYYWKKSKLWCLGEREEFVGDELIQICYDPIKKEVCTYDGFRLTYTGLTLAQFFNQLTLRKLE